MVCEFQLRYNSFSSEWREGPRFLEEREEIKRLAIKMHLERISVFPSLFPKGHIDMVGFLISQKLPKKQYGVINF